MSAMPCDVHGQSTSGRLFGFYMTLIQDGIRYKRRLRICADCVDVLCAKYGQYWSDGFILNRFSAVSTCCSCQKERGSSGTLHPMYVTAYSAKGTRFDYYASYCNECAGVLRSTFDLAEGDQHAA